MARAKLNTTKVRIIDELTQDNLREKNNAMHSKRGDLDDRHSRTFWMKLLVQIVPSKVCQYEC